MVLKFISYKGHPVKGSSIYIYIHIIFLCIIVPLVSCHDTVTLTEELIPDFSIVSLPRLK